MVREPDILNGEAGDDTFIWNANVVPGWQPTAATSSTVAQKAPSVTPSW